MQDIKKNENYLKRFLLALPVVATLVLTFLFFGPVETVLENVYSFQFGGMSTVAPIMGAVSVAFILIGSALLTLFRGKVYNVLSALCLAFALCLYVQGTFMGSNTPPLSGDAVDWDNMKTALLINTAAWIALFSIPFILLHFRAAWGYARLLLPLLIIVMQLAGFLSLLTRPNVNSTEPGYLGFDELCDYSDQNNTLVFMLDRLDHGYIDMVTSDDPTFFDRLDGFTFYDNAISEYAHTRPGMNFILTNYNETLFKEDADDFFMHSWDDGERHILKDLTAGGYTVDLYGEARSLLGKDYASFTPYISNLELSTANLSYKKFVLRIAMLSAYRNFPLAMKPFFHSNTARFNDVFKKGINYDTSPVPYDKQMPGMTVSSDKRYFKFYEFFGSHSPYTLNADGSESDTNTDVVAQTKGNFEILYRAFDKMKEAGIYKDSAIIIVADHGFMHDNYKPLEYPTRIGIYYKPAGVEGTPLQSTYAPVSLRNIPATILKASGLDYSSYGVPLDEVPDDQSIVRDYIRTIADHDVGWKDVWALYYDVAYDAADMDSWTLRSKERIEYSLSF